MHILKIGCKFILRFVLWVCIIGGIWSISEVRFTVPDYKQHIGMLASRSSGEYNNDNRLTHIEYLKTFNYQNVNVRYIDHGPRDGKVIFLIHGTPTSSRLYRKMIPIFAKKGWRVIAPDMVGFGASSMTTTALLLSSEQQAKRINALARELSIDSFVLAGHDQGSLRVQEFLTAYPDKVDGLVLFNGIYDWNGFHPPQRFGEDNLITRFSTWAMGSLPLGRILTYGTLLGGVENYRIVTWTMVNGYLYPLLNGMNKTYYHFITSFDTFEQELQRYHRDISQLEVIPPTMVIRGANDSILVADEQLLFVKNLFAVDQKDIHILPDAGHFIQEEKPGEIANLVDEFFE